MHHIPGYGAHPDSGALAAKKGILIFKTDHQQDGRANESTAVLLLLELTGVAPEPLAKVNSEYATIPEWLKR